MAGRFAKIDKNAWYNMRNGAMKAVDSLKRTAACEALLPRLRDKEYRVHLSAVVSLGGIGAAKAVKPLIGMPAMPNSA